MDKRLAFGRIVGKQVKMKDSNEIGICKYYDKIEKTFLIALESFKNKFNPDGICYCDREAFEIV